MRTAVCISTSVVLLILYSLRVEAQQDSTFVIRRMPFNSNMYSEISPVIAGDSVLFCSDRRFSWYKDRIAFDGRRLYNFYKTERADSSLKETVRSLKTERTYLFNNGPMCLAPDGKTVYLTSEIETGEVALQKDYRNHSGIFVGELSGSQIISLKSFRYNSYDYNVGQPSISRNGQYLFFASDMPGGSGGSDIYRCEMTDGEWSAPVNLGPGVNSPYSENYPHINQTGRLYFTSGRPGGFGKLDIYYSTPEGEAWSAAILLPEPVNSDADDFSFVADDDLVKGYFASNRTRSDDIYEFTAKPLRSTSCDTLQYNSYCYRFAEKNAVEGRDSVPFRHEWYFGDGTMEEGAVVEHCYPGPGIYYAHLDIVNLVTGDITFDEQRDTIVVEAVVQPYITSPDTVYTGQKVNLGAGETNLPGWNIAHYHWDFGDGSVGNGMNVEKEFTRPGDLNIQLVVSDAPGENGNVRERCVSKNIIVVRRP